MKTTAFVSLFAITCSAIALAENKDAPLQIYPKNQARQHTGANLFLYNKATNTYAPTEAGAAWLDDDVTTGSPILAGKQYYLIALTQPELLTNFAFSGRPAAGSVTLYLGDEPAPPESGSWTAVVRDVPLAEINERKLTKPFSRMARYVLVETNVEDPGPVYSLYLYGNRPAVAYNLNKREQPIDVNSVFGPHVSGSTSFNLAGLYADSVISYANSSEGYVGWQKALDDNPESGLLLAPSQDKAGVTVKYPEARTVSRVAILTEAGAKGKLDFYLLDAQANDNASVTSGVIEGLAPAASMTLDGTTARSAVEFPETQTGAMLVRWTPDNGTDGVVIRELNAFGDADLSTYAVNMNPEAIAELGRRDRSKDGKSFKEAAEPIAEGPGSENPEAIAQLFPQSNPYLPDALGFPPNITELPPPVLPPDEPVSQ